MKQSNILITEPSGDYALLDSGDSSKLERFGKFVLSRPDPQALWHKGLSADEWKKADGTFTDSWNIAKTLPDKWQISLGGLKFWIRPSSFKHVGLFPEQSVNWEWVTKQVRSAKSGVQNETASNDVEILNLFGYTGGATLAAAQAGAKVVHVDGSKAAITWARENAELSGLQDKPVRWILDDARAFVRREAKRGRTYDGIIMDPPAFGHGPENELWKIEEHFLPLIDECIALLKTQPLFFLINGYSAGYSALAYENVLRPLVDKYGGTIEIGELTLEDAAKRLLPAGIFARWSKGPVV